MASEIRSKVSVDAEYYKQLGQPLVLLSLVVLAGVVQKIWASVFLH
ncbi:hypothetical protein HAPAU_40750 [Halalkalicoccus paucihalophilus]|uniref:Uncharacterized protein n=1 Tax=Halalkalicoccus paucihalophilus TaxID=1008153 RepID=A0A151A8H6_9EURY|nr:hypothetical protein HAPAU_40750 [Halalkalicoccus paucihalophilus]